MNLHNYLYVIIFLVYFTIVYSDPDIMVLKKGLDEVSLYSSGLIFLVDVNNTSDGDFNVELLPDRCCLRKGVNEDCGVLEVIGGCVEKIPKGTSMTLTAVAPLLDPFDRVGNCIFHLDSKPHNRNKRTTRDRVKITFNTQLKNKDQFTTLPDQIKVCDRIDEDPLNDCDPVDCETYYNGKRSYFNRKIRRCTKVPVCLSEDAEDSILYDPTSNRCLTENLITNNDINFIKDLTRETSKPSNDIIIVKSTYKPLKQHLINDLNHAEKMINDINPPSLNLTEASKKIKKPKNKMCFTSIMYKVSKSKCTLTVLAIVILVQCCLICTMIYFVMKHCKCCQKKKVIRKFFNKEHDVSVMTPLICTSNIDTETAFNYTSESSNVDKKIKCYKACQKERKNMKMSLSDDILSKCLTRRDWKCKPARSDAAHQKLSPHTEEFLMPKYIEETPEGSNSPNPRQFDDRKKSSEVKVNFENEVRLTISDKKDKKHNKLVKGIIKKLENKNKDKKVKKESKDPQCDLSEMEIKCHSYNYIDINSNITDYNHSSHNKNYDIFPIDTTKPKSLSMSTEKGAQASFSNDSIDDFLSERGMIFLAGENLSKCSSSASSDQKNTLSSASNKTSKNNIFRNVLSLLQRKPKHGPSSETAVTKNEGNMDVNLIHMSRASIYSSSNYESDYLKGFKKPRDSRTSL